VASQTQVLLKRSGQIHSRKIRVILQLFLLASSIISIGNGCVRHICIDCDISPIETRTRNEMVYLKCNDSIQPYIRQWRVNEQVCMKLAVAHPESFRDQKMCGLEVYILLSSLLHIDELSLNIDSTFMQAAHSSVHIFPSSESETGTRSILESDTKIATLCFDIAALPSNTNTKTESSDSAEYTIDLNHILTVTASKFPVSLGKILIHDLAADTVYYVP
jgi:hypothetical protein